MAASSEDIAKQLTLDSNPTFRNVLESAIHHPHVSAILIGEIHDVSPTTDAMLANIDVLTQGKRKVIFVLESFNQSLNPKLQSALKKAEKGSKKPLKNFKKSEEDNDVSLFTFTLTAINHGMSVLGAETNASNPFSAQDKKWDNNLLGKIRAMEGFQKSSDRIIKPNEVFSELINKKRETGALCIFIGGAAHPPQLENEAGEVFDVGMQARIPNSVTLYLSRDDEPDFKEDATYFSHERQLTGNYDVAIATNKLALYKDSFDNQDEPADKVKLLTFFIDHLIQGYLQFHKLTLGIFLQQEIDKILLVFNQSLNSQIEFTELNQLITALTKSTSIKKEGISFSFFKKEVYSKETLEEAISRDVSMVLKKENSKSAKV